MSAPNASPRLITVVAALFFKNSRLRPFLRVLVYAAAALTVLEMLTALFVASALGAGLKLTSLSFMLSEVVLSAIVLVGVALLMRHYVDRRSLASLGLAPRGNWLRLLAAGVAFGAGMQTLVFVIERFFGHVTITRFGSLGGDFKLVLGAGLVFMAAALAEEMSVRGYILQNLWEEWGFVPAAILSSSLFALLHFRNPHSGEQFWLTATGLIVFGLWACLSVLWTKSLWLALGCHLSWNLFEGPVYGFPVSGLHMPLQPAMSVSVGWPAWLTGGNFGPEAGLSSILAIITGSLALWWLLARRSSFSV